MHLSMEPVAALLFALALVHTFTAPYFERLAHRFPRHAGALHFLGEVEAVFGLWAIVLIAAMAVVEGGVVTARMQGSNIVLTDEMGGAARVSGRSGRSRRPGRR